MGFLKRLLGGDEHPAHNRITDAVLHIDEPNAGQKSVLAHLERCVDCAYDAIPIMSTTMPQCHLSESNDRWNKMALGITDADVPSPLQWIRNVSDLLRRKKRHMCQSEICAELLIPMWQVRAALRELRDRGLVETVPPNGQDIDNLAWRATVE